MGRTKKQILNNKPDNEILAQDYWSKSTEGQLLIEKAKKDGFFIETSEIKSGNEIKNENIVLEQSDDIITISDFKKKEKMYYEVLNKFFKGCTEEEVDLMIGIIEGKHLISLRFLDWFVTRYCNLYKLSIPVNNSYIKEANFNINISYKAQLKSFRKKHFDPFRRKKKFIYDFISQNRCLMTTLGQLNFFRWALSYDIIKYTENNFKTINSKVQYVNSFFQKYTIDSISCSQTITTSDENLDKSNRNNKLSESDTNVSNISNISYTNISDTNSKLFQQDINLLMNTNNNVNPIDLTENIPSLKKNKKIKPSKLFKDLKNSQTTTKYPQVSRNIFVEL
jgi:hypothetical protein